VVIDQKHPEDSPEVLTEDFSSACSPSLSHEGRFLCFQGRQNEGEAWQVWVLDLLKKTSLRVTELEENCTHPVPLPDGSLIFSREATVKDRTVKELWHCQMDGTGLRQLTFDPSINHHASVLQEGRVLFTSRVQYPDPQSPVMMVMRPDGTKSELYFNGCCGTYPASDAAESEQGYIYFVGKEGELARVNHKRPLHSFENLSAPLSGSFISVVPDGSECLVSYQPSEESPFALYRFDPGTREAPSLIYQGEKNLIDPVLVTALPERPRILPSAVNPDNATGLLMSQDINHSQEPVHPGISGDTLADRIRVSTLEEVLGIVEVKEDGSFYLKLDADTPFRIECLNQQGEVVRGPSDWIYLRPNERRGCVGCHADPELAPKNYQPLAVKEDPVVLSAKMKEISQ
jgi:Tol biopolymer transport system component